MATTTLHKFKQHKFLPQKQHAIIGGPSWVAEDPKSKCLAKFPQIVRDAGIMDMFKVCDADAVDYGDAYDPDPEDYKEDPADQGDDIKPDGTIYYYVMDWKCISNNQVKMYKKCIEAIEDQRIPVVIGGDQGNTTGAIGAALTKYEDLVLVFIDGHCDFNTPYTSVHGKYIGMPLAHLSGHLKVKGFEWVDKIPKLNPKNIIYIGLRTMYQHDRDFLQEIGCNVYEMYHVTEMGIGNVLKDAFSKVDPEGKKPIYLSVDTDGIDPWVAPGTDACLEGGLSFAETMYVCSHCNKTGRMVAMEFLEVHIDWDVPLQMHFQPRLPIKDNITHTTRLCMKLMSEACMGAGVQTAKRWRYV